MVPQPTGTVFGSGFPHDYPLEPRGPLQSIAHSEPCGGHAKPPSTKVIAHLSWCPGRVWPPDLRTLFLGGALPTITSWRPEAPSKALPNTEFRGGHTLPPFTKAIAHLPRGPGGVWHPDLRALFLGAALPMTTSGAPRPLAKPCPFRAPRRPRLATLHQRYSSPVMAPQTRLAP